jgi:hypothetical protein
VEIVIGITLKLFGVLAGVAITWLGVRYRARLLSWFAFWNRHPQLICGYDATWTVDHTKTKASVSPKYEKPWTDFACIEWAAGGYVSGKSSSAAYGEYEFTGTYRGGALVLNYKARDTKYKNHIGAVLLRQVDSHTWSGYWFQNRPDLNDAHSGEAIWKCHSSAV